MGPNRITALGPGEIIISLTYLVVLPAAISAALLAPQAVETSPTKLINQPVTQPVQPPIPFLPVANVATKISNQTLSLSDIKPILQAALSISQKGNQNAPPTLNLPKQQQDFTKVIESVVKVNKPVVQQATSARSPIIPSSTSQAAPANQAVNLDEPLIQLDYSSINDEILMKKTANFVYFNANFNNCRHCQNFYNNWKDLALDIRWWRDIIRFYVINCSEDDNIEVCRRAGVTQFPQVRYYWIMSSSLDQDGRRLRILGKSVHAMRHLVMDKVVESYQEHIELLAQRNKNPLGAMSGLLSTFSAASAGTTRSGSQDQNPLAAFMPMLSMLSGSQQTSGPKAAQSSPIAGLLQAIGIGKGGAANNKGVSAMLPSLGNFMGNLHLNLQSISQLMSALTGIKTMQRQLTLKPIPNNWPDIEPIEVSDANKLLDTLGLGSNKSNYGALLIMETPEFLYTGLEVMFDLNPYSNSTYIARVKDDKSLLSKNLTNRDDIQAPALIYVTNTRQVRLITTAPKYTDDENLRRVFVRAYERRQIKYPLKRVWFSGNDQRSTETVGSHSQEDETVLQRSHEVYMNDLVNAIRSSLMDQVFRHPDLSDDQYNALVRYVYVLINYFPFNNDESLKFFKRLHTWLQNQVSPIDIGLYRKQFHDIDDVFKQREWIACKSLSSLNVSSIQSRKPGLFDNPAQIGKVVSNFTRMLRGQTKQLANLKNIFSAFTSNAGPVMLTNHQSGNRTNSTSKPTSSWGQILSNPFAKKSDDHARDTKSTDCPESPLDRIIKNLTNGSLGSDSSLLKLISAALTGGSTKSKFAREYSCGLWKLAHVMVVNEYIKDSPRRDVKHIVLQSLYHYMMNFYACPTCGNRVSDVNTEVKIAYPFDSQQEQGDSVMLLWKFHNRVNKRLESEYRPGSPTKQQFPPESLCPKCRSARMQNDLISTPNWNEKQVFNFLVHSYRPQSIISVFSETTASDSALSIISSLSWTMLLLHTGTMIACIWWTL